ncbi:MAG TPA: methylenetetrahydrofolate reductase, partial [Myxococcales bacterium]|nr:methylenetetrahydrofolate reductase [Myxococcales bacterium]
MKIRNRLNPSNPCFSFEFFPPKTEEGVEQLLRTIEELAPLEPGFVSVTYGAGGSTRDRTLELVSTIKERSGVESMAHLTCVGHTKAELKEVLDRLAAAKVENVLTLRGDPPKGEKTFTA